MIIFRSEDRDDQSRVLQYTAAVQWSGIAKYVGKIQKLVNAMKNFRSVGELQISGNKEGLSKRNTITSGVQGEEHGYWTTSLEKQCDFYSVFHMS